MKEYITNLFGTQAQHKNNLIGPVIIWGLFFMVFGLIVSINIRSAIISVANKDNSITVTGSAERQVRSDTAKWTITVSERGIGEGAGISASRLASKSVDIIRNYLLKSGIEETEISTQTSSLSPICELSTQGYENCSVGVKGQIANQNIIVETADVEKIKSVSAKIATDITGVNITNNFVEYYFNKLASIRVEMLSEATKNAKERADAVAKAGGASVGNVTSLSSGVFQVTQKNSVNVDDYGTYDTSTIDKKVTATVKVDFSVK